MASERWIDVPLKEQDRSHVNLDANSEGEPADYYRNMFDLVALAFDADITRSVTFMMSREDGMGISDTFPLKLGLGATHHNLSHAGDRDGLLAFAKYDRFLAEHVPDRERRIFLKMDTQGFDLEVFAGASQSLGRIRCLLSELSMTPVYDGMPHYLTSLVAFEEKGFVMSGLYPVNRNKDLSFIEVDCMLVNRRAA